MKKIRWLLIFPVMALALAFFGCQVQASDEIDFGGITNSVYQNPYFGLSVDIPTNWSVRDQTAQRQMEATGAKMLYGNDQNKVAAVKASELNIVNLFAVFKYPHGSRVKSNPNIVSVAENVRSEPAIKKGSDYLIQAKKQLQSGQMQVSFPKPEYSVKLNGVNFDVMPLEMTFGTNAVEVKYYATIMKGYALLFAIGYTTDDEEASLQKILDSVKFKPAD